jgi:membrane protein
MQGATDTAKSVNRVGVWLLKSCWAFLRKLAGVFLQTSAHNNAAAVSFFAMLSLVPFLIVLLSVVQITDQTVTQQQLEQGTVLNSAQGVIAHFLPFADQAYIGEIAKLVQSYNNTSILGIVFLVLSSALFFGAIQRSVRAILSPPSSALKRQARVFGLLLAVAFIFTLFALIFEGNGGLDAPQMGSVVSFLVLTASFAVPVLWFGGPGLRLRDVMITATLFWLLWWGAHHGFRIYLDHATNLESFYGSLTGLVVSVLWIYYASLVFNFCCCVIRVLREWEPVEVLRNPTDAA